MDAHLMASGFGEFADACEAIQRRITVRRGCVHA